MLEHGGEGVGDGGHGLDEDIQRDADDVLSRIADGIADDGGLMRVGALAVALEEPDSMYFLALSNAPPELPMKIARGMATMVAPMSRPPTNSTPNTKPPTIGISSASTDGSSIFLSACRAAISMQRL